MMFKPLACAAALAAAMVASAHAAVIHFGANLRPEVVGATGTGVTYLDYDTVSHDLSIFVTWSGLSGVTTVSHIHCCVATPGTGTAGVAVTPGTLPGFPTGLSSGTYRAVVDLDLASSFTAAFVTASPGGTVDAARDRFINALMAGNTAYLNVHSSTFGGGEIRGFLAVPEPAPIGLALLGLVCVAGASRRRI